MHNSGLNLLAQDKVTTEGHEFEFNLMSAPYLLYAQKDCHKFWSDCWLIERMCRIQGQGEGDKF